MRHIMLHHHIFKNAGTTLDYSLRRQFKSGFAALEDPDGALVDTAMLTGFLERNPEALAISSHHFNAQDFAPAGRYRFFHLALVRRPLARMLSIYKYSLRSSDGLSDIAKQTDLRSFVTALIDRYPHLVDNPQVNLFANHGFYGRPTSDHDLDKASARFRSFSLCGPVERYDEAMVIFEYFNSPVYAPKGLDLSYVEQNVSVPVAHEYNLRDLMGDTNYNWLNRMNERDERLWQHASDELDLRIRRVPNYEERLLQFRKRCEDLRSCG